MSFTSNNSTSHAIVTTAAAVAAVAAISLPLLQSDTASRLFLSPKKLQLKRVKEYLFRWDWTLKKALLYARAGRDQQMDKKNTKVFFEDKDIAEFIHTKLLHTKEVTIMSIEVYDDDFDYYVFLKNMSNGELYQIPLAKFGLLLSDVMEEQLTTTAMCFVADASSGLGGQVLSTILKESKAGVVSCGGIVSCVDEFCRTLTLLSFIRPLWRNHFGWHSLPI